MRIVNATRLLVSKRRGEYRPFRCNSFLTLEQKEKDRLDVAHQMVLAALGGQLYTAPVKDPKRALDIGTGTGIWAMEFGDKWPNADVAALKL